MRRAHPAERRRRYHPLGARPLVVALVDEQPPRGAARMTGDDRAVLQDLHRAGAAADLDRLADEAERHAVLAALEGNEPVAADPPGGDQVERLRHGLGHRRQPAPFLRPASATVVPVAGQRRSAARAASRASVQACSSARSRKLRP